MLLCTAALSRHSMMPCSIEFWLWKTWILNCIFLWLWEKLWGPRMEISPYCMHQKRRKVRSLSKGVDVQSQVPKLAAGSWAASFNSSSCHHSGAVSCSSTNSDLARGSGSSAATGSSTNWKRHSQGYITVKGGVFKRRRPIKLCSWLRWNKFMPAIEVLMMHNLNYMIGNLPKFYYSRLVRLDYQNLEMENYELPTGLIKF